MVFVFFFYLLEGNLVATYITTIDTNTKSTIPISGNHRFDYIDYDVEFIALSTEDEPHKFNCILYFVFKEDVMENYARKWKEDASVNIDKKRTTGGIVGNQNAPNVYTQHGPISYDAYSIDMIC